MGKKIKLIPKKNWYIRYVSELVQFSGEREMLAQ